MKRKILLLLCLFSVGCNRANHILGKDHEGAGTSEHVSQFYVLACCRDNNAGVLTYPAFVPVEHAQKCENVRTACRGSDCQINGDTYLATDVDCELTYKIGHEYYAGHGY